MKNSPKILSLLTGFALLGLQQAGATVGVSNLGTLNPPATLGGYSMSSFDPGSIAGQSYYEHMTAGNGDGAINPGEGGWATWGQNYTGNVYVESGSASLTISLSGNAEAVYFYEEPNQFDNFTMTATDSSGATISTIINGDFGSAGVGFFETTPGGPYLTSITVTATDPTGFAVGEFGLSGGTLSGTIGGVPDAGSTFLLLAVSLAGLVAVSRFSLGQRTGLVS